MSNDVQVKFRGDKSDLQAALNSSQDSVMQWGTAVKGMLVAVAGAFAVRKIFDFGSAMVAMYAEAQMAETRLASVIRATGGAAGFTKDQLVAMSSALEDQIAIGDDVIQNSMAIMATFKNIKGDTFKEAMLAAADMAAVVGGDLDGAVMKVSKSLNDPIKGVGALSEAGVSFTESQKEMIKTLQESGDIMGAQRIILDELAGEFGGVATDNANTFTGQMNRMWNTLGNVGEVIGSMLVPVLDIAGGTIQWVSETLAVLVDELAISVTASKEWSMAWNEYFIGSLKWGIEVAADVFSTFEFLYTNFGNMIEREVYAWTLTMTTFIEDIKHLFTEVAPAYIMWFADNFSEIFFDLANFQRTVLLNMMNNVIEFFEGLWSYLSGGEGGFEFVALTDGFEATMKALPEIAARGQSDMEKYLGESINQMDEMIGKSMNDIFAKNDALVEKMFGGKKAVEIDMTANPTEFNAEVKKAEEKAKKPVHKKLDKDPTSDFAKDEEPKNLGAKTGLTQLADDIQAAAFEARKGFSADAGFGRSGFEFNGAATSVDDARAFGDKAAKGGGGGNEVVPAASDPIKILTDIYTLLNNQHPELIKALKTAGGVI